MKEYYTSIRDHWDTEVFYTKDPNVWVAEAINLWFSAKVLYDQQWEWTRDENDSIDSYPAFWGHRVIRMLMGFAFENLIKAYLIKEKGKDVEWFRKEGNFKIGGRGHDLIWLFEEADFKLSDSESHYLGLMAMCSLWAGRYPIAANENAMPRKRKFKPSSEDLLKRSAEIRKKYPTDPRVQFGDYWDLLHGGVGNFEYDCAQNIFDRLEEELCNRSFDI